MPSHEAAICVDLSSIWLALQHMLCHLCASQAFLAIFAGGREEEKRGEVGLVFQIVDLDRPQVRYLSMANTMQKPKTIRPRTSMTLTIVPQTSTRAHV